jgi:eukaryotic-like serine/threonine-protein kinase
MANVAVDPYLGQLLISRYRLVDLIGKGSMGRVYRADDTLLGGVPVAVKFLSRTLLNERMKFRFAQEARAGALLGQKSMHIVRVIDYGVHQDESPFYVMEYLQGENLSDQLLLRPTNLSRFLTLARHVCLGLQAAHHSIKVEGKICPIVHRDIKPSNILVVHDSGMGEFAKVLDFGIAKFLSDAEASQTQSFMGTLAYCSPEQIEGCELDNRSDIYSLGITFFEMLTGQMPLQSDSHSIGGWFKAHHFQQPATIESVCPGLNLPKSLEEMIMGCMAKSPERRPQTVNDILKTLEEVEQERKSSIPPAATLPAAEASPQSVTAEEFLPQSAVLSVEETCWQSSWPKNKPVGEIVFAKLIKTQAQTAATIWVMLPRHDIDRRLLSTRYNNFLLTMAPHPMMLWITAIYDPTHGVRWLPCYLDMKNPSAQELALELGNGGYYPLAFFPLDEPEQCANVMMLTIDPLQRQLLRQWVQLCRESISSAPATVSKGLLKAEFEKLKPQILVKLQRVTKMPEILE